MDRCRKPQNKNINIKYMLRTPSRLFLTISINKWYRIEKANDSTKQTFIVTAKQGL